MSESKLFDKNPPIIDGAIVGVPQGYNLPGRTVFVAQSLRPWMPEAFRAQ